MTFRSKNEPSQCCMTGEHLPYLSFLFWVMRSLIVLLWCSRDQGTHSNGLPHKKKFRAVISQVFILFLLGEYTIFFVLVVIINFITSIVIVVSNVKCRISKVKSLNWYLYRSFRQGTKKLAKNFEFMIHKSYWINDHLIFHFNVYCKLIQEIISHNDILLVA